MRSGTEHESEIMDTEGLLAPDGATGVRFEPTRLRQPDVGCEGEGVGRGMEGEEEEGVEAEEGGEGGMEGGESPGGSCSVRFARGIAGESATVGVEGARFGARSSSICSSGCCCVGGCCLAVGVGTADGGGSDVFGGGCSASGEGGSECLHRRKKVPMRKRSAAWKSLSLAALFSARLVLAAQPASFLDLGSCCFSGWRSVHTTPCSSTE